MHAREERVEAALRMLQVSPDHHLTAASERCAGSDGRSLLNWDLACVTVCVALLQGRAACAVVQAACREPVQSVICQWLLTILAASLC